MDALHHKRVQAAKDKARQVFAGKNLDLIGLEFGIPVSVEHKVENKYVVSAGWPVEFDKESGKVVLHEALIREKPPVYVWNYLVQLGYWLVFLDQSKDTLLNVCIPNSDRATKWLAKYNYGLPEDA